MTSQAERKRRILDLAQAYGDVQTKNFLDRTTNRGRIPVSGRVYAGAEVKALVDAALDFTLTAGAHNQHFEAAVAKRLGRRFGLSVNSGSSANLLAIAALASPTLGKQRLQPGDEVITTASGFPTTLNPILLYRLTPVFIDSTLPTYNPPAQAIEDAITPRTRAITLAHTLGNPFAAADIRTLADRHGLYLIEDCCDALGAGVAGQPVGSFGDASTVSFYPAHHVTTGEGGFVAAANGDLYRILRALRDWGRDCWCEPGMDNTCGKRFGWRLGNLPEGYDHKYTYSELGYNLKMTDLQAAIGLTQLDRLDAFLERRRQNFKTLFQHLSERRLDDVFILPEATPGTTPAWFGFPLTLHRPTSLKRRQITTFLETSGIATRTLFAGNLIQQPYMAHYTWRQAEPLPTAQRIAEDTFWVGVYPALDDIDMERIADCLHQAVHAPAKSQA